MPQSVQCRRASHTNIVVENLDESIQHFSNLFGASYMMDLPGPDWHACLIEIGGLVIELFAPNNFMLNSRTGPHYLGIEYEANLDEARAAVADHGLRIIRDITLAIHTDPRQGFGVDYEFFDGTFYGPDVVHLKKHTLSAEHWRDENPIGFTGFRGYTHAVADIAAASRFLQSFLGAKPAYEVERPGIGAQAIGLTVSDHIVELLTPSGPGILMQDMLRTGEGIRSTLYGVKDIGQTRAWLESKGAPLIEGTTPGSLAVDPAANLGILFEFAE